MIALLDVKMFPKAFIQQGVKRHRLSIISDHPSSPQHHSSSEQCSGWEYSASAIDTNMAHSYCYNS